MQTRAQFKQTAFEENPYMIEAPSENRQRALANQEGSHRAMELHAKLEERNFRRQGEREGVCAAKVNGGGSCRTIAHAGAEAQGGSRH
jgi:hypothetical protein